MIAVLFEVDIKPGQQQGYLDAAAALRPELEHLDGFISIERFESLTQPGRLLSLSWWRDEAAIAQWRNLEAHRQTQSLGRRDIFADYRIRTAQVVRDYGMHDRRQAPSDSNSTHCPAENANTLGPAL
jgi:heme-degrading monooxygenase HmoA